VVASATTEHPAEAAAWAEYLSASATAAEVRVASSWELPALDQPEYFEAYLELTPPENREAVFQALENPVTIPVIERQTEMQDAVGALLTQVVDGELTAQEALDQAKAELDALIQ
jgi:multiple sugar transport system substrate-binding protein